MMSSVHCGIVSSFEKKKKTKAEALFQTLLFSISSYFMLLAVWKLNCEFV